jgi:asparagine synthase (glutamine-hydrolysing)
MCGILVTHGIGRPFSHTSLRTLRRRGPDGDGFWTDPRINIGHTRLAIIGLDDTGIEPIENERYVLAYNGEIYNFHELRSRLDAGSGSLRGANDAWTLLHAWTRWGAEILSELHGFWAFVVYDKVEQTLTLVRDQFGVKPLYYWLDRGRLCVASMISTILDVWDETPELDYQALSEYSRYQFTFGDKTFLKQIKKILPGYLAEIRLQTGEMTRRSYDDILRPREEARPLTAEWVEETRELLATCVLESTISDTSFTTFCSGGIDSSLITRIATPEVAYHANYSDPDCNETFFARQIVEDIPTRLMVVNADEEFNIVDRLRSIVADYDELTIGSVILPLDDLLAQVKRRYKVILTGTGGDELFGGYVRYQLALGECYQDSYKALFAKMRPLTEVGERFEATHVKGDTSMYRFYDDRAHEAFCQAYEEGRQGGDHLSAMLLFDRRYFLAGLLNIDDKMCGRHSLESRPSLLHQRFVRHVLGLDPRSLFDGGNLKTVLRDVAAELLPKSVLHRTDKMGFTTPIGNFVNSSAHLIREQIMSSPHRDLYDLRRVNFTGENKFSREVFGLLLLDLWLEQYYDRGRTAGARAN